jgi:signal transduction histidine kinase
LSFNQRRYFVDRLLCGIIGVTVCLLAVPIFWLIYESRHGSSAPQFSPITSAVMLTATLTGTMLTVIVGAFLAFGRYRVLGDPTSWWIGMGFASFSIVGVFRVLSFPFLPGGTALVGQSPSSAAWIVMFGSTVFAGCLLAAILDRGRFEKPRRFPLVVLWLIVIVLLYTTSIIFGEYLPVLVSATGAFSSFQVIWQFLDIVLLGFGAALFTKRYLQTGDTLPAYVAFAQIALASAHLWSATGGNRYSALSVAAGFIIPGGYLVMVFGLLSDYVSLFSRERQKTRELQKTEGALRRSNQDLQQFAYVASHDLREPLRNVSLYSQLLARAYREGRLQTEGDHSVRMVTTAAQHMEALITGLLTYARLTGSSEYALRKVDTDAVVHSVWNSLQGLAAECRATMTHDVLPVVSAAPEQITQVFKNLMQNALQYRRADVPLRLHISVEQRADEWLFCVRDNGQGFKQEYAEKIFLIFKRLHGAEAGRTGIGLPICKAIIDRHGGQIWAEGYLGKGAAFFFTLPRMNDE